MKTNKYNKRREDGKRGENFSNSPEKKDPLVRLNKYIANTGLCSRRDADGLIKSGNITVNDEVVTEMGIKIEHNDVVKYRGEKLHRENKVYILLNKPGDYITTLDDPRNRKTVYDLTKNACPERIYPVGRLDRNTTGLLLLTNDGELTKILTHPRYNKKKIYHIFLDRNLSKNDRDQIASGITLSDGYIKVDNISYPDPSDKKQVGVEIHSGKNRIIRRIFEHFGYNVEKLDRVYFAGLTKKNLPRGKWRFLSQKEIARLKMGAYK